MYKEIVYIFKMQQLNELTDTINKLSKVANAIIKKTIPLMEELLDQDNDLVDELAEMLPTASKDNIIAVARDITLEWIADAEKIRNELPVFTKLIMKGKDKVREGAEQCPLLCEVWCGDTYDEHGLSALKQLGKELTNLLNMINRQTLIKYTHNKINDVGIS